MHHVLLEPYLPGLSVKGSGVTFFLNKSYGKTCFLCMWTYKYEYKMIYAYDGIYVRLIWNTCIGGKYRCRYLWVNIWNKYNGINISPYFYIETYTSYHSYLQKKLVLIVSFLHGLVHGEGADFSMAMFWFVIQLKANSSWNYICVVSLGFAWPWWLDTVPIFVDIDSQMVVRLGDEKTMVQIP